MSNCTALGWDQPIRAMAQRLLGTSLSSLAGAAADGTWRGNTPERIAIANGKAAFDFPAASAAVISTDQQTTPPKRI
jgi:hypothetical protein